MRYCMLSAGVLGLDVCKLRLLEQALANPSSSAPTVIWLIGSACTGCSVSLLNRISDKAGEPAERDRLSIWFGGIRVAHKGARDPGYDEAAVSAQMKKPEIYLKVALGLGKGRDRVLTCDLTKDYVAINGDYRS